MAKGVAFVLILNFLLLLVLPFSSLLAQTEPVQHCKLKHDITIDSTTIKKGNIVGPPGVGGTVGGTNVVEVSNWAVYCSLDALQTVADLVMIVAVVLSGVALLASGVLFIIAGESPERVKKAKSFFFGALIGVVVIILSRFIPAFARFFLGI